MAREFLLPELAESVVEGEIVKWLVAEGETVTRDQPLVEVMTDKVTVELPSPFAGVLEKQLVKEGEVVPVNAPIAHFADEAGVAGAAGAVTQTEPKNQPEVKDDERSIVEPGGDEDEDDGDSLSLFRAMEASTEEAIVVRRDGVKGAAKAAQKPEAATGPYGRVLAVPAARKLAREHGVAIEDVPGSGPNGRVRVDDVKRFAEAGAPKEAAPAPSYERVAYKSPADYADLERRIPVRGLRRVIAAQMVASHLQTVRTLHVDEADVSSLVALRNKLKPLAEKRELKLSFLPFIMKAVVAGLKEFPIINSSLDEEAGEIVHKAYYNIGMAVATESGLVVPVIKDVDKKSLLEISADISALAAKARSGKLAQEDIRHGTFSITNIGSLGGLFSFPIINVPEAAILGVHSIKRRPVVLADDRIVARDMLYLSMSFDHRVIDGAEAAMFTGRVIEILETPESLLL
ncbi:MAG: 2-oxo acid dehydrogenase subunit E2 [Deinococcota bacterium]|nr:2-oxo acid dehydrogenase subunit E2 [Deinococcota bacterium]